MTKNSSPEQLNSFTNRTVELLIVSENEIIRHLFVRSLIEISFV